MAIADRLRDATRPTNSIENMPTPELSQPEVLHGASPPAPSGPAPAAGKGQAGPKPAAYTTEPEVISKAFYVEEQRDGSRRYFEDHQKKSLAFSATDTSVSTKREDLRTIQAAVTLAEARGWTSIQINGTASFKREAWIEAQARGIETRGYQANDVDRQEADRRRAERGQVSPNEIRPSAPQAVVDAAKLATPSASAPAPSPSPAAASPKEEHKHGHATAHRGQEKVHAPHVAATAEKGSPAHAPAGDAKPSHSENLKAVRRAEAELSPDGRLMLAALSEKIDRQMNRMNTEGKAEMKAFTAAALIEKERKEGPVVLSAEQKRSATAPEPVRATPAPEQPTAPRQEPESPRLSRGR